MNTSHPELETLAELVERSDDDLDSGSAEALAHVDGCAQCTKNLELVRAVRGALRSLPPVSMPDDVAARLEAAVRSEAAKPLGAPAVAVLPTRKHATFFGRLPHLSAAGAVAVLLVVALGAGIAAIAMSGSHSNKGTTTSGSASVAGKPPKLVLASGTNYLQDTIRAQVAGLVVARVPGSVRQFHGLAPLAKSVPSSTSSAASNPSAAAGEASAATAIPMTAAGPPASNPAATKQYGASAPDAAPARIAPGGPLANPAALEACVLTLTGGKPVQPVLVDYASYNGQPATIIVLPDLLTPDTLDVWVEADSGDCVKNGDAAYYGKLAGTS